MPQPAALDALEDPLVRAYRRAWDRVLAEQAKLGSNPKNAVKRARLQEMAKSIYAVLDELDDGVEAWVATQYPQAYALGVTSQLGEMVWTNAHQDAVQQLAQDLFKDLLKATKGVRESTKDLVRSIARDEALHSTIAGGTARDAAKAMADKLAAEGIHAVTYKDGSRHGLTEYSEMSMRTKTAEAYNTGTLNSFPDTKYWEIFDGPNCGLTAHDDGQTANGMVLEREQCQTYLISHPNCRRAFGPRPDIKTKAQIDELAKNPLTVGSGQTTIGQQAAQVEQDKARAELQARRAARQDKLARRNLHKLSPSPDTAPGGLSTARRDAREASLSMPSAALPTPVNPGDIEYTATVGVNGTADPLKTLIDDPDSKFLSASKLGMGDVGFDIVDDMKALVDEGLNLGATQVATVSVTDLRSATGVNTVLVRQRLAGTGSIDLIDDLPIVMRTPDDGMVLLTGSDRAVAEAIKRGDGGFAARIVDAVEDPEFGGYLQAGANPPPDFHPKTYAAAKAKPLKVKKIYTSAADVPSVTELIDAGFDPEDAIVENKRLTKNARNVERRAKKKAGGTAVEDLPQVGSVDPVKLDLAQPKGTQPKALYDGLGGPGGAPSAKGIPTVDNNGELHHHVPWYDRIPHDTAAGETIPVKNLTIEGYTIKDGVAAKRGGISYLLEKTPGMSDAEALAELEKHVTTVQNTLLTVPEPMRRYQRGFAVVKGQNPGDAHWAEKYNTPNFQSAATGGMGGTTFWNHEPRPGTILHEFGHNVDSGVAKHGWITDDFDNWSKFTPADQATGAYHADSGFTSSIYGHSVTPGTGAVTSYGANNAREDFAESVRLYFADRHNGYFGYSIQNGQKVSVRFSDVFPERAAKLDEIFGLPPIGVTPFQTLAYANAEKYLVDTYVATGGDLMTAADVMSKHGIGKDLAIRVRNNSKPVAEKALEAKKAAEALAQAEAAAKAALAAQKALEAEKLAKLADQLKDGKLTTDGLSFGDKTGVGLKKNNAYKKALAAGKSSDEALAISLAAEQEAIASKLGIKLEDIQKATQQAPKVVEPTIADLTTSDKVGIGVKKSNAYKKALKDALDGRLPEGALTDYFAGGGGYDAAAERYARAVASQVETSEIQTRLARILAERRANLGVVSERVLGERGEMVPTFSSSARTKAQSFLGEAGKERHGLALSAYDSAGQAKANIAAELGDRLNDRETWKHLQAYVKKRYDNVVEDFDSLTEAQRHQIVAQQASNLVQGWASTSGDHSPYPLAMQRAIKEYFNLDAPAYVRGVASDIARQADQIYDEVGDFLKDFVRVQYEHTQEELAKAGIREVSVYRGMNLGSERPSWGYDGHHRPVLQPANSWSTSDAISLRFGTTFLTATIPAEQVLGSARTGFGCRSEKEYVILDSPGKVNVTMHYLKGSIK